MRRRDKDTQGLADLEYLIEGGIRGAPTELTPGPEMYVPVVDELQSAMDAKESGVSALAALKEGNFGAAGLDGLMAMLAAAGAVPVVGRVPATIGKAIKKTKGKRAFHSTSSAPELFETDIFHPVSKGVGEDIGIHVGVSPYTSNNAILNVEHRRTLEKPVPPEGYSAEAAKKEIEEAYQGKTTIPLRLDPDLKPLRIPDMGTFKQPDSWIRELNETDIVPEKIKKDLINAAEEILTKKNYTERWNYFNTKEGKASWLNKLREVGKKHGFDSFVYENFSEGWASDAIEAMDKNPLTKKLIREPEDSYMLMYPRQVKYEHSKTKDYTVSAASKRKGGTIVERNPYNYTAKAI